MKKYFDYLTGLGATTFLLYIFFSFANWSFNAGTWAVASRNFLVVLSIIIGSIFGVAIAKTKAEIRRIELENQPQEYLPDANHAEGWK